MSDNQLDTNQYLSDCDPKDIISFNRRDIISFDSRDPIYLSKLYSLIEASLDRNIINTLSNSITHKLERKCNAKQWLEDGEKCEILKADASGWKKGSFKLKINVSLEFILDEPEETKSPLDDVRQELK